MRMSFVTQLIMPCVMFVLLIFCGQQGYMVYKDYKKVTNRLSDSKKNMQKKVTMKTSLYFFRRR
ncbi:hypothetical protein EAS1808013_028230 [Enterobacter asburiae]|nr:hypothetical protein EAS1808013_028230 [Enterobacter asburiae]